MSVVTPDQSNPGEEITAASINTPVNQLADVINGGLDDSNISGIDGSKIANGTITYAKTDGNTWWEEIGRESLAASGGTVTFPAKKWLKVLCVVPIDSSAARIALRFNGDSGNNYASRVSDDFGSGTAATSLNGIPLSASSGNSSPMFFEMEITNIGFDGKTGIAHLTHRSSSLVSTAPSMRTSVVKWVNSSQITSIEVYNPGSGNFTTGAEIIVLGHD